MANKMAKKTAQKKKTIPAKAKTAKATKTVKSAKAAVKPKKTIPAKMPEKAAPIKPVKPALMTKKGKKAESDEVLPNVEVKKTQTIVSMMESEKTVEGAPKVEKVSKVKPIKIERGNLADEKAKWIELNRKLGKEKAFTYKMTETYPALTPLQHKVLGWGYILTNENDRLEVLFENGIRMLISNYKS